MLKFLHEYFVDFILYYERRDIFFEDDFENRDVIQPSF